jgi:hypothetical protein
MRSNHSLYWSTIFSSNNALKKGIATILIIVLIQNITGCNPGKNSPTYTISPTVSTTVSHTPTITLTASTTASPTTLLTITPTASATVSPTITYTTSYVTQWYVDLIYDLTTEENPKSFLDLDTMEIVEGPQSDIKFDVGVGNMVIFALFIINGARSKSMGAGNIDLATCRKQINLFDEDTRFEIYKGNHICVLSNRGRMFLLRDENVTYSSDWNIITLRFFIKADNL